MPSRDEKLGYGKSAKLFQEKTGRTVNRSSIRKICLNKDELFKGIPVPTFFAVIMS